jgi:subtilisin family serine protease
MREGAKLLAVSVAVTAACVALAPGSGASDIRRPSDDLGRAPAAVPGELLVRFQSQMSRVEQARVLGHHAAVTQERLPRNGLQVVRLARGTSTRAVAAALEREAGVLYAEPNFVYHLDALPDDPFFGDLWGMTAIQAPAAWDTTTGSPNVRVAVVDTGIAYDHPDLAPNVWTNPGESGGGKETNGLDDDGDGFVDDVHGWDFVQGDNQPLDFSGHGSHVAGTIGAAGNNGTGVAGVDWQTSLMALRAGNTELQDADIINAFDYACAHGAKVVNASFGGPGFSQAMLDTITSPGCANTLFVAAAGNDGVDVDSAPSYPCSFAAPNLVCVAATDTDGATLAGFSNYGLGSVDIAAPGVDVLSTVPSFQSVYEEDFESSIATSWTVGGSTPHWARQADGAGGFVLSDSAAGNYAANADNWARPTNALDLTGKQGCAVQYDLTLDTQQDHDFLLVEGSSDLTNWTTLDTHSGSVDDFFLDDLSAFDGSPTFYLRFRLTSDADGTVGDGALVDNVVLTCLGTTFSSSDYFQLSGTSMAAPHVAGVAALIWSAVPSASVAEVKAELMHGATQLTSLSGKVASGGFLNAAGAISAATSPLPDTTLLQAPLHLTRSRATSFTFGGGSATVATAGFEWSLDGGAWTPTLLSTLNLSVGEGIHTLFVRARDVLTRVDPTPASWTWEVDETPPAANILSPRAGLTFRTSTVRIVFATDPVATLECTIDDPNGRNFKPCSSPIVYRGLANRAHTFVVRATDAAGNAGYGTVTWVVNTVRCVVPNLMRRTLAKAKKAIGRAHCRVGRISRAYSHTPAGLVIGQKPRPRAQLPKNSAVRLVVSRGRRRR